jgi:hypothetical protein
MAAQAAGGEVMKFFIRQEAVNSDMMWQDICESVGISDWEEIESIGMTVSNIKVKRFKESTDAIT